jgi:hypothetical protein
MPLRHLMKLHADLAGEATGMHGKVDGALAFAQQVIDLGAVYFLANPRAAAQLKRLSEENRTYVTHEYFNENWRIMAFSEVAEWLDDAKLSFVASAHLLDQVEPLNLTPECHKFLTEIRHPILRQSVRDYFVNQHFRRDIYIKGPRRLSLLEQEESLQSEQLALTTRVDDVPMKIKRARGEIGLSEEAYRPMLELLADRDSAPKPFAELAANLKPMPLSQVLQAVLALVGAGHAHPAQQWTAEARKRCRALNRYLYERARSGSAIQCLASPVTGGIPDSRLHQLFLLALAHNRTGAVEQSEFAWSLLSAHGRPLIKDGKTLESAKELMSAASDFATKRVPVLKALEIA